MLGVPLVAILAIDFLQKRKETDKVSSEKAELEAELAKLRAEKEQLQQAESTEKVEEEKADN